MKKQSILLRKQPHFQPPDIRSDMDISDVRFDCRYFRGDVPCQPNKLRGKKCTCDEYSPTSQRILIIKLGALGDVLRTTSLAVRFKKMYASAHITWITDSTEILPTGLFIDSVYTFEYRTVFPLVEWGEFDIAINLDKDKEACTMLSMVKAKKKFGFTIKDGHIAGCNKASERKIITGLFDDESKNNTKSYPEEIFEICELEFQKEETLINLNAGLAEKWKLLHDKAGDKKVVGLNTGCGPRWKTRLWNNDYWESLILKLDLEGYFPVLLGGVAEDNTNRELSKATGAYYPGTFSLEEFIAITSNCDLVVTAVSMMLHIAVALKKPLVLFNNIFNRHEFELYGRGIIIEPDTGCDCYYGIHCTRQRHCMLDLPADKVYKAITDLI